MKRLGGWWRLWVFLSVLWGTVVMTFVIADWPGNVAMRILSEEDMKLLSSQTQKLLEDAKQKDNPLPDNLFVEASKPSDHTAEGGVTRGKTQGMPWERFQKAEKATVPPYAVPAPDDPFIKYSTVAELPALPSGAKIDEPGPHNPYLITYVMRSGQELRLLGHTGVLDAAKQDYERVQNLALRNARLKLVGFAFLFWLVPGLSILAFGLGFRWVVRGFKPEPS